MESVQNQIKHIASVAYFEIYRDVYIRRKLIRNLMDHNFVNNVRPNIESLCDELLND